jgi:hypothetical protein
MLVIFGFRRYGKSRIANHNWYPVFGIWYTEIIGIKYSVVKWQKPANLLVNSY